ncbi:MULTISPECIES: hypothetical protein [unclassified Carboxylicivirga]|uniref:hypothetical protein n=1 Tax=Carboxylicivirga TaxID=1628153 RepID=UPI003D333D56
MADSFEKIEAGRFYHIYNRGINSCNLFDGEADYKHFLVLYEKFIDPIAETYAWTLLSNHFHCLVKIKEDIRYKYTMEKVVKANARNVVRTKDADKLGWVKDFATNKWATVPLPDGVNDPSALKGNDVEEGENDGPSTFRGIADIHPSTLSGTSTQTGLGRQSDDAVRLPNPTKHFSHLFNAYAKYYNTKNNRHGALFERPLKEGWLIQRII